MKFGCNFSTYMRNLNTKFYKENLNILNLIEINVNRWKLTHNQYNLFEFGPRSICPLIFSQIV